jgi:hypothetical protein
VTPKKPSPDEGLLVSEQAMSVFQNQQRVERLRDGDPAEIPARIIKTPTKEEIDRIETGRTCGSCDHFEYEEGQNEIRRQRFFERMVHDERWKKEWLAQPNAMSLDQFAMCGQSDDMIVPAMAPACDAWRPRRKGLIRSLFGKVKQRFDPKIRKDGEA